MDVQAPYSYPQALVALEAHEIMTRGQRTALVTFAAGVVVEAVLDVAYRRWPPILGPLGAGIGAGTYLLLIGPKADAYPSWFGVVVAIGAGLGIVIARTLFGDSCPL